MTTESIRVSASIPAPPARIYDAWLDARQHSAMTGGRATSFPGGRFTAWDGYISGWTLVKEPPRRIVQAWRTSEFPEGSTDSRVEILLDRVSGGTEITIFHSEIPEGQGKSYEGGWQSFYFTPMRAYFAGIKAAAKAGRSTKKKASAQAKGKVKAKAKAKAKAKVKTRAKAKSPARPKRRVAKARVKAKARRK